MTITMMTKDLNPPTPFLFPGVGEQASQSWPRGRQVAASPKIRTTWRASFSLSGGARLFFISNVRNHEHEHGVLF